ncbi:MAG: glutamine synthetase III [Erysipelotrichales bacterium]|nr:glutamine synthetase III [Erysipelotrichales bacterium]
MFDTSNFGTKVFNEKVMKEKLPSPVYKKWVETMEKKDALDRTTADAIAHAMKEWALEHNCTHYCHWFQPLTGLTAQKHDAFIDTKDGETILKFSGKSLIKGEPDASSFPNGGLRSTFEARGYTYWDCSSPAFIRDNVLYIPTIFVGFHGETLDTKWPLLKSIDAISAQATRIVNAFGDKEVTSVTPYIGLEQEYFLVDREMFLKREDLFLTGRTLFGTLPSKGQELDDHYFGAIPERVHEFMKDVNSQLWELGIYAKSEHNEVAPAQFELAPIFNSANVAVDQNQIIMDVLQRTALKHNLVCLLHEKPFKGVNGSGKHNNWSLITNTGINLFDPGKDPHDNIQFLIFACALIQAIDDHPELIRMASSNPGNDFRLGANEAPPAIVSIFLGKTIENLLNQFIEKQPRTYEKTSLNEFGISSLAYLPHDSSDRNRTSPIAFTGNKFEFRMLGSSMNAASLNVIINTIMADSLKDIADKLENHKYRQDKRKAAIDICVNIMKAHNRILFDGNGYSNEWVLEAKRRGLPNINTFIESLSILEDKDTIDLFVRHHIFSIEELKSHADVQYSNYVNIRLIECRTFLHLVRGSIIPTLIHEISMIRSIGITPQALSKKIEQYNLLIEKLSNYADELDEVLNSIVSISNKKEMGLCILKQAMPLLDTMRALYDSVENHLAIENISYPIYENLFFGLDY